MKQTGTERETREREKQRQEYIAMYYNATSRRFFEVLQLHWKYNFKQGVSSKIILIIIIML